MFEGKTQVEDPFLHLLAKTIISVNERQEETINILLEIRTLLTSISTQLNTLSLQQGGIASHIKTEKKQHPLLILSIREELKETLIALVKLYLQKKRHISIKELENHLNFGYRTIAIHLKQLEEANPSPIEPPLTRRTLEEYLKEVEKQGNPQEIDLDLPMTAGRAYFYKPLDNVVKYIDSMDQLL